MLTKKNTAVAGEIEGHMKLLASSSSIQVFMASDSVCDNGKTLPSGGVLLGKRSMAQSLEWWCRSWEALVLLKTSARLSYSGGRLGMEEGSNWTVAKCKDFRGIVRTHCWRQQSDHWVICFSVHEICWLCTCSQGSTRITGFWGDWMRNRLIVSVVKWN